MVFILKFYPKVFQRETRINPFPHKQPVGRKLTERFLKHLLTLFVFLLAALGDSGVRSTPTKYGGQAKRWRADHFHYPERGWTSYCRAKQTHPGKSFYWTLHGLRERFACSSQTEPYTTLGELQLFRVFFFQISDNNLLCYFYFLI